MPTAALYCRISDDREGREVGVKNQKLALMDMARAEGWTVPDDLVFIENDTGASSKSRKPRPEYDKLLAAARAGRFDVLACYSTSRLTRRPRELMEWLDMAEKGKLRAVFKTGPAADWSSSQGRAVALTLAAWDANEAETIADRVAFHKLNAAREGKRLGGRRPFGYDLEPSDRKGEAPRLVLNDDEAQLVRDAVRALLDGKISLRQISRDWNDAEAFTTAGKTWSTSTVRQVLTRPINGGLVQHQDRIMVNDDGSYVRNEAPAIVSTDDYLALCAMLANPERATATTNEVRWLSSGIARCALDGYPMRSASRGSGENVKRNYRCTRAGCGVSILARYVDEAVRAAVLNAYMSLPTSGTPEQQTQSQAVTALLKRLDENAKAHQEILTLVKARATTAAKAAPMLTALADEERELNDALTAERSKSVHAQMMTGALRNLMRKRKFTLAEAAKVKRELAETFDAMPIAERRLIVRGVLRSVKVARGNPGGVHKNMPELARRRINIKTTVEEDEREDLPI